MAKQKTDAHEWAAFYFSIQTYRRQTRTNNYKPVGDWVCVPSPNFVAMATRVGPEVQLIADVPQAELPCRERDHGW